MADVTEWRSVAGNKVMPTFELQTPDGRRFQIEAPSADDAALALDGLPKPKTFPQAAKSVWDNPSPFGVVAMAKGLAGLVTAPGRAMQGEFSAPPAEVPGQISEADIERARMAQRRETETVVPAAASAILAQAPGGMFGAPRGALGSGPARPGTAGGAALPPPSSFAPTAAPRADVIEAAGRINVPVPRYMVSESRMDQGLAAGLQNIPGAGDKIAKAADVTQKALGSAVDRVKEGFGTGSPAVAGSYAKDALAEWVTTGSKKIAERVYDAVDNLVRPDVGTELKSTAQAAQNILARRAEAKIPGQSAAVNSIMDAATTPGGMSYQGIKGLRSFIGEMTPEELVSQGLRGSEIKQLYGALTNDLRMSVLNGGGPTALQAFNKANRIYESISDRRGAMARIIGTKGDAAPEAVFARLSAMAGSKSSADIERLVLARKTMGPEAWNEVASAAVAKLGRDPSGEFSIKRFLTAYGNMSQAGRNQLFKTTGRDDLSRSLNDVHFVTKEIEEKLLQFYNPSGTAKSMASTGVVMGVIKKPIETLVTLVGGNRLATLLSEPASARATADWLTAYRSAIKAPHAGANRRTQKAADQLADIIVKQSGGSASDKIAITTALQAVMSTTPGYSPTQ